VDIDHIKGVEAGHYRVSCSKCSEASVNGI